MPWTPTRLPTKLGESLAQTMPLPNRRSPKSATKFRISCRCLFARNDLQQFHVTHRIEKVGAQKMAFEPIAQPLAELFKGQPRCVGGDDGMVGAYAVNTLEQGLFDFDVFDHHLNDPVAVGQMVEIILQIADTDPVDVPGVHEQSRVGFGHGIQPGCWAMRLRASGSFFSSSLRSGGTISSNRVRRPALAISAAMPPPMTPAPMTATCLIFLIMIPPHNGLGLVARGNGCWPLETKKEDWVVRLNLMNEYSFSCKYHLSKSSWRVK